MSDATDRAREIITSTIDPARRRKVGLAMADYIDALEREQWYYSFPAKTGVPIDLHAEGKRDFKKAIK